jgi:hypothetical protein
MSLLAASKKCKEAAKTLQNREFSAMRSCACMLREAVRKVLASNNLDKLEQTSSTPKFCANSPRVDDAQRFL